MHCRLQGHKVAPGYCLLRGSPTPTLSYCGPQARASQQQPHSSPSVPGLCTSLSSSRKPLSFSADIHFLSFSPFRSRDEMWSPKPLTEILNLLLALSYVTLVWLSLSYGVPSFACLFTVFPTRGAVCKEIVLKSKGSDNATLNTMFYFTDYSD